MAALTALQVTEAGVDGALTAAAGGGDTAPCGPGYYARFNNASGADITVTIDDPTSHSPVGATAWNPDDAVVVPAGGSKMVLLTSRFANATDGLAHLTYSGVTTFTVGIFRI